MRKLVLFALALLVATAALAHAGHQHHLLGTIKSVAGNDVVLTSKEGKELPITLTANTTFTRDGAAAAKSDLAAGTRVAVDVADDGRTAVAVRLAGSKH